MDNGKLSVRYARALLNTATQQGCDTEVYDCLMRLTNNYGLAIGKFDEARQGIDMARKWYQTNGNYCLLDAVLQSRRADWLRFDRMTDVKMHEQPDRYILAIFDIPEAFAPQALELKEYANSANIKLADGRPVRFDFTPIPTQQTAP